MRSLLNIILMALSHVKYSPDPPIVLLPVKCNQNLTMALSPVKYNPDPTMVLSHVKYNHNRLLVLSADTF